MHSGFPDFRFDKRKDIVQALLTELLDSDFSENSDEIFKELRKFSTKTLLEAYKKILNSSNLTALSVNENDSDFFQTNPVEKLRNKDLPNIPIILGSNSFEGKVPSEIYKIWFIIYESSLISLMEPKRQSIYHKQPIDSRNIQKWTFYQNEYQYWTKVL